jgi:exosortase family protein XrtF
MGNKSEWKEFKPAIFFILKFLGVYMVGNIFYGIFITHFEPHPDPITVWVTQQVADILNLISPPVTALAHPSKPTVWVLQKVAIISVFEGCNGLNVLVVFFAFVFAFGPVSRKLIWFLPLGIVLIHVSNLFRIGLLFFVSRNFPHHLYFLHKYFFTAFIYAVVFALWFYWIQISKRKEHAKEI